ncbi:MAG: 2-oxoglutarate dehydrogenase complex dihydrolipoyllysine-residue succinyltransferase [Opitutales bacterium]
MPTEVKVPAMGESISSGILAAWHVSDGDYVEAGQALYDLETDKVTSEGTSEVAGVIQRQATEGDEVEIGQVVALVDTAAKKPAASDDSSERESAPAKIEPVAAPEPSQATADSSGNGQHTPAAEAPKPATAGPAVRRLSAESGVSPESVSGSGPLGRVTKADMVAAIEQLEAKGPSEASAPAQPTPIKPKAKDEVPEASVERQTRRKMTPLRRRIAERLVYAQQEAAILTTFNECDMSAVMALRKKHQDAFVERHGIKLGFMSFFVKATVQALQAVPSINAQIEGETVIQNHFFDIGIAVGTEKGLIVPVVRDCDGKGFAEIEQDIIAYAKRAKAGKIQVGDLEGGVFTISNGGVYGSMLSTPILNPPQSGILGLHNIQERAVVREGQVVARPMMYLALSYDHRLVDGKEAVTFLVKIKEAIEDPARLLFGI